jgi:hypothetical protein
MRFVRVRVRPRLWILKSNIYYFYLGSPKTTSALSVLEPLALVALALFLRWVLGLAACLLLLLVLSVVCELGTGWPPVSGGVGGAGCLLRLSGARPVQIVEQC